MNAGVKPPLVFVVWTRTGLICGAVLVVVRAPEEELGLDVDVTAGSNTGSAIMIGPKLNPL